MSLGPAYLTEAKSTELLGQMPVSQTATGDLLLRDEEFLSLQPQSSPTHFRAYAEGGMFPRRGRWGPQKRYRRCFSVVCTLLAAVSVVFLIHRCRGLTVSSLESNSAKRRLGGAYEGGDEEANEQSLLQVCGGVGEKRGHVEGVSITDPPHPSQAPVALSAQGLGEGERPRKRMRDHKPGNGRGLIAMGVRLFEGEAEVESKRFSYLTHESSVTPPSRADFQASGMRKSLDLSQSSGSKEGHFKESELAAGHGDNSSEGVPSGLPHGMVQFSLEEALMASEGMAVSSLSVDVAESSQPVSPLLSEHLSAEFLDEQLEPYIIDALEAEEGAILEQWILDPEAPMPPSPVQMSADEVQKGSPNGSVGGDSSLGVLVKSAESRPRGRKPSQDSSDPDERRGNSPHDLHKTGATSESITQKVGAGISLPSPSPPLPLSYVAEAVSISLDVGVFQDELESEAAGPTTSDARADAWRMPLPSSPVGEPDFANHPFYRLPAVPLSVLQEMGKTTPKSRVVGLGFWGVLNLARDLLAIPVLSLRDAELLCCCAQMLRSHAVSFLTKPLSFASPAHFAFSASIRFLVADALWSALAVLRGSRATEGWFRPLMEKMLRTAEPWSASKLKQRRGTWRVELVSKILAVVDIYKAGRRPSAKDVVVIKQMLFCGEFLHPVFRQSLWDRWREADKLYWAGLGQK